MSGTLLYIEDDPQIAGPVARDLRDRGYAVRWLQTGERAVEEADGCHLAILDVMLPGLDGFTVGQRLKSVSWRSHSDALGENVDRRQAPGSGVRRRLFDQAVSS